MIEAALRGDVEFVVESLKSETVDVNYIGIVSLRMMCVETVLREEEADEIEIQYRDFVTDVTPFFAAAHSGHVEIARKFWSLCEPGVISRFCYHTAAREGHRVLLDMLLKAVASQSTFEDALLGDERTECGTTRTCIS
ncbi:unnamed protein product [Dovyalis caffra]|uniref:Ankyrin repeat protein n=1 Tax=Dovyalis caffra TaxID=77055 RepID=A0AAV1SXK1_9ROSI|nr:unnamed protein product [Dovyalis caffra]